MDSLEFISFYDVDKLNNLFKNLDTISFLELITQREELVTRGYEKSTISRG